MRMGAGGLLKSRPKGRRPMRAGGKTPEGMRKGRD